MSGLDGLGFWRHPDFRAGFERYRDVAANRKPAKFLLARAIAIDAPLDASEDALWRELEAKTPAFVELWRGIAPGELPPPQQRTTHVLLKGNFLNPGDVVEPQVPAAFHPLRPELPRNRLGLALWLLDERNPLTARVAVNRFWAQLFGRGIVETEEDFGTQGTPPSHPELLDWLAVEFRKSWDVKALLRLMVTSAAYRQSSAVTPELLQRDPYNRLISRGPRFRLEAEMVRDQALALAGLLSRKIGRASCRERV